MRALITRRDALTAIGVATFGLAAPEIAHGGETMGADDMVLGDADAPVTILEYSSLTCPHCARFHNETLPRIKERYIDTGKARLVYRDFPFDQTAVLAAAVAHCAGKKRYFGFLEVLFRTQKSWAESDNPLEALVRVSRLGGLKREAIEACIADQELLDRILASRLNGAREFNVNSTPTFIINGEKVVGAQPFERFEEILEGLLSRS